MKKIFLGFVILFITGNSLGQTTQCGLPTGEAVFAGMVKSIDQAEEQIQEMKKMSQAKYEGYNLQKSAPDSPEENKKTTEETRKKMVDQAQKMNAEICKGISDMKSMFEKSLKKADDKKDCSPQEISGYKVKLSSHLASLEIHAKKNACK